MTDKERILKEVIRVKNEVISDNEGTDYEQGFIAAYECVELFINSLPEDSISEDLEEAAQQYAKYTAAPPSDVAYHFVAGANWKERHMINKACDAYCQICGHYAHDVPIHICRQDCQYYTDFRKAMEG